MATAINGKSMITYAEKGLAQFMINKLDGIEEMPL